MPPIYPWALKSPGPITRKALRIWASAILAVTAFAGPAVSSVGAAGGPATQLKVLTTPRDTTLSAFNGSNSGDAVSGDYVIQFWDSGDLEAAMIKRYVKLSSNSTGRFAFFSVKYVTPTATNPTGAVLTTITQPAGLGAACYTMAETANMLTFRYRDTQASLGFTRTITATAYSDALCTTPDPAIAAPAIMPPLKIQVAPKSVTVRGLGFSATGQILWELYNPDYSATTIASSAQCASIMAPASKVNCILPGGWPAPASGVVTTIKFVPPPADLGTLAYVTVTDGSGLAGYTSDEASTFSFFYGPTVTDVTPQTGRGSTVGDDSAVVVSIKGYGFGSKPVVMFGNATIDTGNPNQKCVITTSTACWRAWSATLIRVQAPTKDQAGGGDYAFVSVVGQAEAYYNVDQRYFYDKSLVLKIDGAY